MSRKLYNQHRYSIYLEVANHSRASPKAFCYMFSLPPSVAKHRNSITHACHVFRSHALIHSSRHEFLCYLSILWNGFRSIGNMWIINIRMTFFAERCHRCHRIYDKGFYIPTGTAAALQINCYYIYAVNMRGAWKLYIVQVRQYQTVDTMFTRPLCIYVLSFIETYTLCLYGLCEHRSAITTNLVTTSAANELI